MKTALRGLFEYSNRHGAGVHTTPSFIRGDALPPMAPSLFPEEFLDALPRDTKGQEPGAAL